MPTLDFKGKQLIQADHLRAPVHVLNINKSKSLVPKGQKPSLDDNLIIHGDNFKVLKTLIPAYAGRINCIYIDPPYNTGNEGWVYNDNVNTHPLIKEWLKNKNPVDREDLEKHDKWLCLMWRRLKLLHELLADDGAIFISIDDNEQHRLRMIMDEIFGANNFVANIIWQKKYAPANDAKYFSDNHDFVLCYAKNKGNGQGDNEDNNGDDNGLENHFWKRQLLPRSEKQDKLYKYDDKDGRGLYCPGDLSVKSYSKEYDYSITNPITGAIHHPPKGRCWITSKKTMKIWIKEKRVFFGQSGKGTPILKRYLREIQDGIVPLTVWTYDQVGHSASARKHIKKIFYDQEAPFENPKTVGLIKRILQVGADKNALVLDSFAGSGTTAEAVLELNKEDGGNRKFILVQCEEYDKTKKKFVNVTDTITAERVRRVIKGFSKPESFTYCELGEEINIENMLTGKSLPSYETVARMALYTATGGRAPDKIKKNRGVDGFFYESKNQLFYLIYKPDLKFLKSKGSALNGDVMERIARQVLRKKKKALVYAPHKFVGQKELTQNGIIFCNLPYGILK